MVFVKKNDNDYEVIDGQQRLVTSTMIMAAIRNSLLVFVAVHGGDSRTIDEIDNLIMPRGFLSGSEASARLVLGNQDRNDFRRYVQLRPGDVEHQSTTEGTRRNRIREAFSIVAEKVEELTNGLEGPLKRDKLERFAQYFASKITVIQITVDDDVDAYTVFESLNARGLDLSVADLLKNHLFGLARNRDENITTLYDSWGRLMDILGPVPATRFLRRYWLSHYEFLTERKLYRQVKNHLQAHNVRPSAFLNELMDGATTHKDLITPKATDKGARALEDLDRMGMTQGLSFLMAARETLTLARFLEALNLVESLAVRNTITGGRNPNQMERSFSSWSLLLRRGEDFAAMVEEAKEMLIDDEEFTIGFKQLTNLRTAQARYLLRKIEWHGNDETQMAHTAVEIEHILPQTPGPEWGAAMGNEEDIREGTQMLGNLTLLGESLNRAAAARPFVEKRDEYYSQSNFDMTKRLCELDSWNLDKIKSRQSDLADRARIVWRI